MFVFLSAILLLLLLLLLLLFKQYSPKCAQTFYSRHIAGCFFWRSNSSPTDEITPKLATLSPKHTTVESIFGCCSCFDDAESSAKGRIPLARHDSHCVKLHLKHKRTRHVRLSDCPLCLSGASILWGRVNGARCLVEI